MVNDRGPIFPHETAAALPTRTEALGPQKGRRRPGASTDFYRRGVFSTIYTATGDIQPAVERVRIKSTRRYLHGVNIHRGTPSWGRLRGGQLEPPGEELRRGELAQEGRQLDVRRVDRRNGLRYVLGGERDAAGRERVRKKR